MSDVLNQQSTVFVVDDDRDLSEGLRWLLRSVGLNAYAFGSTEEFRLAEREDGPCCLILDIRLPGMDGFDFQAELARTGIQIPIVFITGYGDVPTAVKAIKRGAVNFLPKPLREQDILDAVRDALQGDKKRRDADRQLRDISFRYSTLSSREREVMSLLSSGLRYRQIALRLGLSEVTIKKHRQRVLLKLGAANLPALVRMADRLQQNGVAVYRMTLD